jgi:hypothetical protein
MRSAIAANPQRACARVDQLHQGLGTSHGNPARINRNITRRDLACSAAVDREEAAARDLQRLSDLTQPCQDRLAQSE